jgi:uncharacterized phage infection (PIP) family protein YhgE
MSHRQVPLALVAAAVAAVSLFATSTASAASASASEAKQNTRIKQALKGLTAAQVVAAAQSKSLTDLKTLADGIDTRLKTLEGGVPQILGGIDQLKTGLTTAGAGLTQLKTLAGATEYGIGQVVVLTPSAVAQAGSFVVTPDIPDTVQQAQTTQQFVAGASGNLAVLYGVRSGESDGTGSANPAALCRVTVTNAGGTTQTTAANPNAGGLPFQPVDNKSTLTSTDPANAGFPFGLKQTGADADQTTTYVSTVPVAMNATYTVGLSCVDTSPSTTDPSA